MITSVLRVIVFLVTFSLGIATHSLYTSLAIRDIETDVKPFGDELHTPIPEPANGFHPDGGFELSSHLPNSLREFEWISVTTGSAVGYGSGCGPQPCTPPPIDRKVDWIPASPNGAVVTKNHLYEWRSDDVSANRFSFVTEEHNKISYQFSGQFAVDGYYEKTRPKGVVLSGKLTKKDSGITVADENISLTWFGWDEVDIDTFRHTKIFPNKKSGE